MLPAVARADRVEGQRAVLVGSRGPSSRPVAPVSPVPPAGPTRGRSAPAPWESAMSSSTQPVGRPAAIDSPTAASAGPSRTTTAPSAPASPGRGWQPPAPGSTTARECGNQRSPRPVRGAAAWVHHEQFDLCRRVQDGQLAEDRTGDAERRLPRPDDAERAGRGQRHGAPAGGPPSPRTPCRRARPGSPSSDPARCPSRTVEPIRVRCRPRPQRAAASPGGGGQSRHVGMRLVALGDGCGDRGVEPGLGQRALHGVVGEGSTVGAPPGHPVRRPAGDGHQGAEQGEEQELRCATATTPSARRRPRAARPSASPSRRRGAGAGGEGSRTVTARGTRGAADDARSTCRPPGAGTCSSGAPRGPVRRTAVAPTRRVAPTGHSTGSGPTGAGRAGARGQRGPVGGPQVGHGHPALGHGDDRVPARDVGIVHREATPGAPADHERPHVQRSGPARVGPADEVHLQRPGTRRRRCPGGRAARAPGPHRAAGRRWPAGCPPATARTRPTAGPPAVPGQRRPRPGRPRATRRQAR